MEEEDKIDKQILVKTDVLTWAGLESRNRLCNKGQVTIGINRKLISRANITQGLMLSLYEISRDTQKTASKSVLRH